LYLDCKFGLSLSKVTLLFDLSLDLDGTLAQRKAQQKAKSKVKVTQCATTCLLIDWRVTFASLSAVVCILRH